ncbi:hypothetical protein SGRIM128S_05092 [Streptomyces griseomycini]
MLLLIRRRSLTAHLAVVAGVAVTAMLAGTLALAQAMFLSAHDLTVVTTVVAMAAVVSTATALLLGRWVVARSRELALAARSFGDGGDFAAPDGPSTAELTALSRELEATSAKLAESRDRERALESSRRELVAWISHDLRTPLAGLRAMAEALEDGVAADPGRYLGQIRTEVERLNDMVGDLFELSRIHAGTLPSLALQDLPVRPGRRRTGRGRTAGARTRGATGGRPDRGGAGGGGRQGDEPGAGQSSDQRHPPHPGRRHGGPVCAPFGRRGRAVGDRRLRRHPGGGPAPRLRHRLARQPRPYAPAGAGLGLAIVRGIVEAHAGRAEVRNVQGGCCFSVTLPAV